ncbi:MAG: helix-turn-helix domain-containing protein [Kouleothrix sp.]|nr:helix-turn-helix domain-containing protein [Kouleothrix sp.]
MFPTAPKTTVSNYHTEYHRPRLEKYYVQVPQVLLREFADLSDGAKLTYQVLLSFDYVETSSDEHKGIVYPSIDTLMALRRKGKSTIYSHLAELEEHGLIKVLIGEGIWLYNPQEGQNPSHPERAARTNHSAQERPSQSSYEDDERRKERTSPRLTFQKSGRLLKEEEENQETKHYQYSEVGDRSLVVDKLLKLGFEQHLAGQFVRRYGAAHVDEQITNLCRALQHGVFIRSFARWLYRAIERDYVFVEEGRPRSFATPRVRRSIGQEKTLPNGDVVYELVEYSPAG